MASVQKALQYTATTDGNGVVVINGEVPSGWTDVLGAVVSPVNNAPGNLVAVRCKQTGANQFTATCFQRNGDGTVTKCTNTQVSFMFVIYGTQ